MNTRTQAATANKQPASAGTLGKRRTAVNMVLNVHRNRTAYQGRGERGKGVKRWGEREII